MNLQPGAIGFDSAGDVYERARPSYPPEAVQCLSQALRVDASTTLVDLGAGTGKLTRLLAPAVGRVIAVEPLAGMWRQLVSTVPAATVVSGVAEAIPFMTGAVDAVTAAQSFHWFRTDEALPEIHRVLRPGGRLGLVWNRRDESIPWVKRFTELLSPYEGETPREWRRAWEPSFAGTEFFGPLEEAAFESSQELDRQGLVDRASSISFVAALDPDARRTVLGTIEDLAKTLPARFELPYRTTVYWCERR